MLCLEILNSFAEGHQLGLNISSENVVDPESLL